MLYLNPNKRYVLMSNRIGGIDVELFNKISNKIDNIYYMNFDEKEYYSNDLDSEEVKNYIKENPNLIESKILRYLLNENESNTNSILTKDLISYFKDGDILLLCLFVSYIISENDITPLDRNKFRMRELSRARSRANKRANNEEMNWGYSYNRDYDDTLEEKIAKDIRYETFAFLTKNIGIVYSPYQGYQRVFLGSNAKYFAGCFFSKKTEREDEKKERRSLVVYGAKYDVHAKEPEDYSEVPKESYTEVTNLFINEKYLSGVFNSLDPIGSWSRPTFYPEPWIYMDEANANSMKCKKKINLEYFSTTSADIFEFKNKVFTKFADKSPYISVLNYTNDEERDMAYESFCYSIEEKLKSLDENNEEIKFPEKRECKIIRMRQEKDIELILKISGEIQYTNNGRTYKGIAEVECILKKGYNIDVIRINKLPLGEREGLLNTGFLLNSFYDKNIELIIVTVVGFVLICVLFTMCVAPAIHNDDDTIMDTFDKDPNTWTEQEEENVNDFFDWQEDYEDDR